MYSIKDMSMRNSTGSIQRARRNRFGQFFLFLLAAFLQACTFQSAALHTETVQASPTLQPTHPQASHTPSQPLITPSIQPATPSSTPSPTPALPEEYIPSPFPTSLEAFGMVYDADATLEIPPVGSNEMLFWGQGLPVKPVEKTPEFIVYPTPQSPPDSIDLITQAGCQMDKYRIVTCSPDSPLSRFGCDFTYLPQGIDYGLESKNPLVAECGIMTEEWEAARAGGVVLSGCAFKSEIHYIFKVGDEYILVSSKDELRDLLAPIDSPAEALSYAQMVTGLKAYFSFTYEPTLMYFQESIEGTHVTENDSGFELNLFNFAACSCEPWINSQITIQVDRAGNVTWVDAVPVFMTTGWSCAD